MTPASLYVKLEVAIVPQSPFIFISTRPSKQLEPFTSLTSVNQDNLYMLPYFINIYDNHPSQTIFCRSESVQLKLIRQDIIIEFVFCN